MKLLEATSGDVELPVISVALATRGRDGRGAAVMKRTAVFAAFAQQRLCLSPDSRSTGRHDTEHAEGDDGGDGPVVAINAQAQTASDNMNALSSSTAAMEAVWPCTALTACHCRR